MLSVENESGFEIDTSLLTKISAELCDKDVECLFVNSEDMRKLNLEQRGRDETTDVLSFPLDDLPFVPLGSIVINLELSHSISKELGHSLSDESALLFIHGMLHLLGFDHEIDNGEMRKKEEELIKKFKLPQSLICRVLDDEL